jgi:hypothetical protein
MMSKFTCGQKTWSRIKKWKNGNLLRGIIEVNCFQIWITTISTCSNYKHEEKTLQQHKEVALVCEEGIFEVEAINNLSIPQSNKTILAHKP